MPNLQRMAALRKLSPLEATQAWLDGAFGMDEEPALCDALRQDPRITLSDRELINVFVEAMAKELSAAECFERILSRR